MFVIFLILTFFIFDILGHFGEKDHSTIGMAHISESGLADE